MSTRIFCGLFWLDISNLNLLSAVCHANAITIVAHGADRTSWRSGVTDILSERDEQPVDFDPILLREFLTQCEFCFVRRFSTHIAPAVRNAMNVGIHTDA